MNVADWVIVGVLLLAVLAAAAQGFFAEAFGLAGLVIGYVVAAWQYHALAIWFSGFLKSQWLCEIAGFLVIFFAILLVASIAGRVARWAAKEVGLSWFDRFLGGALGLLKGALLVAVILMGMTAFTPTSKFLDNSELAPYFLVAGRAAIWLAPSDLRARFYQGLDFVHHSDRSI